MFFSGDTSRHFVHLLSAAGLVDAVANVEAVSISERAAVALRTLHWRRIRIAARPNQDAMLALLEHE
jgi:uroporphyrinogen-III synthase